MTFVLMMLGVVPGMAQDSECVPAGEIELTAIERTPPFYPIEAFQRNIEGYAVAQFDVTPDGRVTNVEVVEQEPAGVFDTVVVEAVRQWRFDPPVSDLGEPVAVCGERKRFNYNIDS